MGIRGFGCSSVWFHVRTHRTIAPQDPVHSHGGPIRRRQRRYILTADQSDAGSADAGRAHRSADFTGLPILRGPPPAKIQGRIDFFKW
eukprot:1175771-Prorocentrum_minimum.AAC.2